MNASQLVAWFVCLALALFGSLLAVRNSGKLAVLERQFVSVSDTAAAQREILADVHQVLQDIERLLRERPAGARSLESPPVAGALPARSAEPER